MLYLNALRFAIGLASVINGTVTPLVGRSNLLHLQDERAERPRDILADAWVATDGLGRRLPTFDECGPRKDGKYVGIFYFLWLGAHGQTGPHDLSKVLIEDPKSRGYGPAGAFHHWAEPELGYYLSTDPFVFRQHASMLSDAGVDVIVIDVTNSHIYEDQFKVLCDTWMRMREQGNMTPQFTFLAHTDEAEVVNELYETVYSAGAYQELWFLWNGKPLILASSVGLPAEVEEFFEFRKSWAWSSAPWFGDGRGKWPWLDHSPQSPGLSPDGEVEQISVAVAQHATTNIGRSHRDGKQPPPEEQIPEAGVYFSEQWDRALQVDPDFLLITGWNEWVAQRFIYDGTNWPTLTGRNLQLGESYFVDVYNQEFSRDIEPMRGGHEDSYYYQMVAGIRRFKGVSPPRRGEDFASIDVDGSFFDWREQGVEFWDSVGDTEVRAHPGWGDAGILRKPGGEHDFLLSKVGEDERYVYFYLQTAESMILNGEKSPVWLLIDADSDSDSGWFGYDFRISVRKASGVVHEATLWAYDRVSEWIEGSPISVAAGGGEIELAVPKAALHSQGGFLDFKWVDGEIDWSGGLSMTRVGDMAPNRRANYRYGLVEALVD